MKIRLGFVANSSSSSFIIFLPHKPTSIEDLADMIGVDREDVTEGVFTYGQFPMRDGLCAILEDILHRNTQESLETNIGWVRSFLDTGHYIPRGEYNLPSMAYSFGDPYGEAYDLYDAAMKTALRKDLREAVESNPGYRMFAMRFDDDTELGAALENGYFFGNATVLRTSHH
jgi:hypothetical protein